MKFLIQSMTLGWVIEMHPYFTLGSVWFYYLSSLAMVWFVFRKGFYEQRKTTR